MKFRSSLLGNAFIAVPLVVLFLSAPGRGQENLNSHEVLPDGRVTFRYKDPNATKVLLELDGVAKPLAMEKNADGVWSVVTAPLSPEIYGYALEVDGQARLDPNNTEVKPNLLFLGNAVAIPGSTPQPWQARNVPHGEIITTSTLRV
jgi:hypothetical protein